jgi:hypothetical protein
VTLKRKQIELKSERVPLKKLLNGFEIREAARNLENFRLKLNEYEILYGAKIKVKVADYGECYMTAVREETDEEYAKRVERARILAEQRQQAKIRRDALQQQRKREAEKLARSQAVQNLKQQMRASGLTVSDLIDALDPNYNNVFRL